MSRHFFNKTIIHNTIAAACTVALLFAVAVVVEAQTDEPLFEEDIVCSIQQGPVLHVAPASLQHALELSLGAPAQVETLGDLLARVPVANESNLVRFEGGYPAGSAAQSLCQLGYVNETAVQPEVPGVSQAVVRSA